MSAEDFATRIATAYASTGKALRLGRTQSAGAFGLLKR